jgi:hypothetical protein
LDRLQKVAILFFINGQNVIKIARQIFTCRIIGIDKFVGLNCT